MLGFHFSYPATNQVDSLAIYGFATDDRHLSGTEESHSMKKNRFFGLPCRDKTGILYPKVEMLGFDIENLSLLGLCVMGKVNGGIASAGSDVTIGAVGQKIG